ncbi:M20 family peptidase [Pseudonocardiaceae bacterium YIM PH 21723]|nr:M20 family peptidase [Pseudonocardiaceae bacterium YIM PH 21723]
MSLEPGGTPPDQFSTLCHEAVGRSSAALIELSHGIHAEPELAFQEHRAASRVADLLEREGFRVTRGVAELPTALVAEYGTGELTVGLCAEYDALPEVGHACGHNIIAASSVGAALALATVADPLDLRIKLIGTPAEETGGGKVLMLERGVFDDVAFAMMVHPAPHETVAMPTLAIAELQVTYRGKEAHAAAAPDRGVNAADALTIAQVAIGLARQHLEKGQMVHGIVTHGGAAPNIVPATTTAVYYLRAPDSESLARLETRIQACFQAGSIGTGCTYETTELSPVYTELQPDQWLVQAYRSAITGLGRTPLSPHQEQQLTAGSTDMGNVSQALPAIHPTIAIDCGEAVNHQPEFTAACASPSADQAVLDGASALALTAVAAATDAVQRAALLAAQAERGPISAVVPASAAGGAA